jgi:hypothetical protein
VLAIGLLMIVSGSFVTPDYHLGVMYTAKVYWPIVFNLVGIGLVFIGINTIVADLRRS